MEEKQNCRKIKLLQLLELLRQETDEQHPLTTGEICARLEAMGIPCDRRTLSQDISLLNRMGYEVMSSMMAHQKGYYIEDRNFSIPELRILIDAVQAAQFITEKKSGELIGKIAALGGSHQAEVLTHNIVRIQTHKHSNENIYYNVDALERAITLKNKILFRYFDMGLHGEKVYRRDGHRYVVEPLSLVFHEDNYYLVCYSSRHRNTSTYRVDRMDSVTMLEEPCTEEALALREDTKAYAEQTFKMFRGPLTDVKLEFSKELIGPVLDKFGEHADITETENGKYVASVRIQISPVFWGWLFQFAGQMRILSPESLKDEYRTLAQKILDE